MSTRDESLSSSAKALRSPWTPLAPWRLSVRCLFNVGRKSQREGAKPQKFPELRLAPWREISVVDRMASRANLVDVGGRSRPQREGGASSRGLRSDYLCVLAPWREISLFGPGPNVAEDARIPLDCPEQATGPGPSSGPVKIHRTLILSSQSARV